jgi:hypothetical protein
VNGIKQGNPEKQDKYNKAIAKPYFSHKKIDSLKLSIERLVSTDVN